jgi:hypothetical protein
MVKKTLSWTGVTDSALALFHIDLMRRRCFF